MFDRICSNTAVDNRLKNKSQAKQPACLARKVPAKTDDMDNGSVRGLVLCSIGHMAVYLRKY